MTESRSNSRNYLTYISFIAVIVGVVFAVLYLMTRKQKKFERVFVKARTNPTDVVMV